MLQWRHINHFCSLRSDDCGRKANLSATGMLREDVLLQTPVLVPTFPSVEKNTSSNIIVIVVVMITIDIIIIILA